MADPISALQEEYKRAGVDMTGIGLNGAMLDIELPKVIKDPILLRIV